MKPFYLFLLLFWAGVSSAQTTQTKVPFKRLDYPASKYRIKSDTFQLGKIQIAIVQVQRKDYSMSPFFCRSWMYVKSKEKILKQLYFDIEPVGGCSGLFAPKEQPVKDLFIVSKFGDYEGQITIIDTSGKITSSPGGSFYLSKDKRYLFSPFDSDIAGLTVYDLEKRKVIFSKELDEDYLSDWYFQDGQYFSQVDNNSNPKGMIKLAIYNFQTNKLIFKEKPAGYPKKGNKLQAFNVVQKMGDCSCGL